MPKDLLPIQAFEGGLNDSTNPRDIKDNELSVAINVDTNRVGSLKSMGSFEDFLDSSNTALSGVNANDGYGIEYFQVDTKFSNTEGDTTNGHYIAIHKPATSGNGKIIFYQDPVETSGTNPYEPTFDLGANTTNSLVSYLYVDGGLRVFDSNISAPAFEPQKIAYIPKGRSYFKGASNNDLDIANNTWYIKNQFVEAPSGGDVQLIQDSDDVGGNGADVVNPSCATDGVELLVIMINQGSVDSNPIGWGKDATTSQIIHFYASFVYENDQESQATNLGSCSMGGNTPSRGATIVPIVRPNTNASDWNQRIVGVNIYYRKDESNEDILYLCGKFPTITYDTQSIAENNNIGSDNNQYCYLLGDKTGKTSDISFITAPDAGVYLSVPPTIFTHSVSSGIPPSATSVSCHYKTSALVNRKLYVGNIKQKTNESPTNAKHYPDRLLKSVTNRFDVLPDNNFIDVAIKDGENIVKLMGIGSRLYMFKESTLYVIAVAGGEEYLEGTYPHLGIKHPSAVVKTDVGLFWVNQHGAYVALGTEPPQSVTKGKIKDSTWSSWITNNTICGYNPVDKQYIIIKDASAISNVDDENVNDIIVWNLQTNSWNLGHNKIGAANNAKCSNMLNYTDSNGNPHLITFVSNGNLIEWKTVENLSSLGTNKFEFQTKEITGNSPNLRKKFYKLYITYKLTNISVKPTVSLELTGKTYNGTVTLNPSVDFEVTSNTFKTAEFVVDASDKSKVANVYGASVKISGSGVHQSLEINDMSLITRMKSVK